MRRPRPSAAAQGLAECEALFSAVHGRRWPSLKDALLAPVNHVAWINPFVRQATLPEALEVVEAAAGCKLGLPAAGADVPPPAATTAGGLLSHYVLDGASPLPALALGARPGHAVLDMCAAPGGKSLVLCGTMFGESSGATGVSADARPDGVLIVSEPAPARRARLRNVLQSYLPHSLLREASELPMAGAASTAAGSQPAGIGVSALGGTAWGDGATSGWRHRFDRILVDAPCSSERHILRGAAGAVWSRSRLRRDARLQMQLLHAAMRLLRRDGARLVYATCSLAEEENDGVVAAALAHPRFAHARAADPLGELARADAGAAAKALAPLLDGIERTAHGAILLPDRGRFGPLYWAVIET